MEKTAIKFSVGENAKNIGADVKIVQELLNIIIEQNELIPFDRLKTDGIAGKKTKHIIREYQRRIVGMAAPDGRVDPNGKTFKSLIEKTKNKKPKKISHTSVFVASQSAIALLLGIKPPTKPVFSLQHFVEPQYPSGAGSELRNLSKEEFVKRIHAAAKIEEKTSKVPAAITTAQAILETGYGKAVPIDINTGKYSYNLFGIKGIGSAGYVSVYTHEFYNGKKTKIIDKFKAYTSFPESIKSRTDFLKQNKRYKSLFSTTDPEQWAKGLQASGYATDPKYADKLISIMNKWSLK